MFPQKPGGNSFCSFIGYPLQKIFTRNIGSHPVCSIFHYSFCPHLYYSFDSFVYYSFCPYLYYSFRPKRFARFALYVRYRVYQWQHRQKN